MKYTKPVIIKNKEVRVTPEDCVPAFTCAGSFTCSNSYKCAPAFTCDRVF